MLLLAREAEWAALINAEALDMNNIGALTTAELQQDLNRDGLHVLNVQTDKVFGGELIPGSQRVPLDAIGPGIPGLAKDAEIVTYCGGPACSQSIEAANKLTELGYTNVRAYREGLEGWKAAGNGIVASTPALVA